MRRAAPASHLAPTLLMLGLAWLAAATASAQSQGLVVRDGTLGSGPLEVGPGVDPLGQPATYLITPELGEQRGTNLFHSFERFGIGTNETATFTGPDPINGPQSVSNVISRVTGGNESRIEGTLRSTIPGADVWLLNPNGVVFGQGGQLDVEGSFHASTADSLGFGSDGLERFYSDSTLTSVLSTARPMAFGFLSESGAALLAVERSALEVPYGETLELAGGDVSIALDAALAAPGGEVRLEAQGEVLISQSLVDVSRTADAPGTISIRGGKIVVERSSLVRAENESGVPEQPGGSISIAASESVLVDASLLSVSTHAAGNAGTIDIASREITLRNGVGSDPLTPPQETRAGARAETTSTGRGGEIRLQADDLVTLANGVGVSASAVGSAVTGDAGNVTIAAPEVEVARDSYVSAETAGEGDGGKVSIEAGESLVVDDSLLSVATHAAGDAGTIDIASPIVTLQNGPGYVHDFSDPTDPRNQPHPVEVGIDAGTSSSGQGGSIEIEAGSLLIQNGAMVSTNTTGGIAGRTATGDAGVIRIDADSMEVSSRSQVSAGIFGPSEGNAGTIQIDVRGVLRVDGARLDDSTQEPGAADYAFIDTASYSNVGASRTQLPGDVGTVDITAGRVELVNGARIMSECASCTANPELRRENAARVGIVADEIRIDRGATISVSANSSDAGTITIDVGSMILEGGLIVANGNGGTINILNADSVTLERGSVIGADGSAGTINILDAGSLVIAGGVLAAETRGAGNAGAINILDAGSLALESGIIATSTDGAGSAGKITVRADTVTVGPGQPGPDQPAFISASSFGGLVPPGSVMGNAGEIDVEATKSILLTNAGGTQYTLEEILLQPQPLLLTGIFSSTVLGGDSGSIRLIAPEITVTEGAGVATSTVSGGDAGTIDLRGDRILVSAGGWVDSTGLPHPDPRVARSSGDAGIVTLDANEWIEVSGFSDEFGVSRVLSSSLGSGAAGEVTLHAPRIAIDAGAVLTTALPSAQQREGTRGGGITLDAGQDLLVTNGGRVDASTFIAGAGGRIDATAGQSIRVEGEGSGIASRTGGTGLGGSVSLRAPEIDVRQGGEVSAESAPGFGALDSVLTTGIGVGLVGSVASDPSQVTGNAGSIELAADSVRLAGATIATNAEAADGGNVEILAKQLLHLDRGVITATVADGTGGNITIDPEIVLLENGSRIEARAGAGTGGRIQITADNYFAFPGSLVSADSELGIDGIVEIRTPDVNLAGDLTVLPTNFLDASSLMRERCAARASGESAGSFAVRGNGGIPPEPDGWLRASVLSDTDTTASATPPPIHVASLAGPLLAQRSCD